MYLCTRYLIHFSKTFRFDKETIMSYTDRFRLSDEHRRDELIRVIEHAVERLTLQELESLYYDMSTKNYIND